MKIKLVGDLGTYKNGQIIDETNLNFSSPLVSLLIRLGWAEEVKDEIDIEEIRKSYRWIEPGAAMMPMTTGIKELSQSEEEWFTSYRIVKAVIEKLNGDWKPDWSNIDLDKWTIMYNHEDKHFMVNDNQYFECTFWYLKDQDTTKKVISLCEPELKVLFGVK